MENASKIDKRPTNRGEVETRLIQKPEGRYISNVVEASPCTGAPASFKASASRRKLPVLMCLAGFVSKFEASKCPFSDGKQELFTYQAFFQGLILFKTHPFIYQYVRLPLAKIYNEQKGSQLW